MSIVLFIEYEPSIIFQTIKENCSEMTYLPELPKTVHLLLSPECLHNVICVTKSNTTNNAPGEEGSSCVNSESNTDTRGNQQLSNQWVPFLSFNDLNSPPPMIFILWNCRGIKNQIFAMHFKELLNYHKQTCLGSAHENEVRRR